MYRRRLSTSLPDMVVSRARRKKKIEKKKLIADRPRATIIKTHMLLALHEGGRHKFNEHGGTVGVGF